MLKDTAEEAPPTEMLGLGFGVGLEDPTKVVPEEVLPFEALDVNDLLQEEDLKSVRTGQRSQRGIQSDLSLTASQWMPGL